MNFKFKSVLLSTAYLPPIEYFYYLLKSEHIIIEQFETYPKQSYRNRCKILSGNGELSLSVPVRKIKGNHTQTRDIAIFNKDKWQLNHWRALQAAYSASPFFLYYADDLEAFFTNTQENLIDFNLSLTGVLCKLVGFETNITQSASFVKNSAATKDLRNLISPKKTSTLELFPAYIQVFESRYDFLPNLSIIDLLFNLGPETMEYLKSLK